MRVLLDTSAYSAFMKGHGGAKSVVQEADELALSAVVLGELKAGFARGGRRRKNEAELADFLSSPRVRTLAVDDETADRYTAIYLALREKGAPIAANDMWIAASAMQHGLRLATLDTDFLKVSQVLVLHLAD